MSFVLKYNILWFAGVQLLQFCASFPDRTYSAIPIACSSSHSARVVVPALHAVAAAAGALARRDFGNFD